MGENTKEEVSYPSWINIPFITKALRNSGEENPEVTSISVGRATRPGDNYVSTLFRVTATLSGGEIRSLLVKGPTPDGAISEYCLRTGIFERESFMLAEVVPKIEALLEEAAPGRWPALAARCPLHGADPVPFVVLQDLAPLGFRLADKGRGLGLRHCLLALRTLARFHAGSYALLLRNPELQDQLTSSWRHKNEGLETMVRDVLQTTANVCRTWTGFEEYAPLLEKFREVAIERYKELNEPKPGEFNVIVHGDYWVNNMMYRYDEDGLPSDYRLVDLQLSHVASPAIDLLMFLSGSTSEDVSIHHYDLLVREYYQALKGTMDVLGLQAPSFETLQSEIDAHGCYSLFFTLGGVPVLRSEKVVDLDGSFKGDSSAINYLYENPKVKKWFQRVLPEYRKKGWIPE